jgi:CPA1 family monovalent cation:H+ antiporter
VDIALGLLAIAATVLAVTALAERLNASAPLLLMLVGIGGSFVPFIPEPSLSSDLVLLGFLPPLLYATAVRTSVIDFRTNRRSIGYLSVLLVVVTALSVGLVTWLVLPVPFAVAFALGAVVAPPDAVAATTIARRAGMPRRLVAILEGESLVNDATAITCLRVALAAIGGAVTVWEVTLGFLLAAVGGVAAGLAVAALVAVIRKRVEQPVFDTAVSLMIPFAAYVAAEEIGWQDYRGSGVIAVVVAGLVLGHLSPSQQSGQSRISERLNWATIQFLLENAVFLMIGLQARRIFTDVGRSQLAGSTIAWFCAAILLTVIGVRLVWVAAARLFLFRRDPKFHGQTPPWSHTLVVGWAGLRGVVTLAAAFLIPIEGVANREILILGAMVVTAGTLLLQGLTLPVLVRRLALRGPDPRSDALQAATVLQTASQRALAELESLRRPTDSEETVQLVKDRIIARPTALWERLGADGDVQTPAEEYRRLRLETIQAERDEVIKIRSAGRVDHEVIEEVLTTLDVEESMLTIAAERSDRLNDEPVPTPETVEGPCEDLAGAPHEIEPDGSRTCADCEREGTRPVHLRICLSCGRVGCCDSSVGRHADQHFQRTEHPVMRSFEPGEQWRWCYQHERVG